MNINSIQTYNQQTVNTQAKLPTGAAAKETVNAFDKIITNAASPMSSTDVTKTLSSISDGIGSVEEQLKADAQAAKMQLKALFNKLSGAEAVKLDEDGFDINDIDDEELVTVVDRIKLMLAAYNENYQAFAGAFDMPDEAVLEANSKGATSAGTLAAKVAAGLKDNYMPETEDNVADVKTAVMMAEDVAKNLPMDDATKSYMIANDMDITVDDVYKARHSAIGYGNPRKISEMQWQQIRPQVEKIVNEAGLQGDKEVGLALDNARWLVENELPVTKENLIKKGELDKLSVEWNQDELIGRAAAALRDHGNAAKVSLTSNEDVFAKAAKAIEVVNKADYETVDSLVQENRMVTIEAMAAKLSVRVQVTSVSAKLTASQATSGSMEMSSSMRAQGMSAQSMQAYRALCEARVLMTANSTISIMNRGIDIYGMDLENLVEMLHEEQTKFIANELTKEDAGSISEADLGAVSSVQDALMGLRFAPSAAIGRVVMDVMEARVETASITIQSVSATAFNMQRQYEQAGQAYETMSTKARSDMGDSVKAAMKNSGESILNDMGYEVNETNLRAVRILAYNSMEMSDDNLAQVKALDSMLNQLMDNMTPQVTYDMIKQGINPMEASVEELNQYINANYDKQDATVKYSEFLYKLERQENLSDEERSQYIGIYKMFHMFKKDGGKAVGALLNQNAELSLKNLVMAVQSEKRYGMDVSLDVDAGMAAVEGNTQYFENLFRSLEKSISPAALKAAQDEVAGNDGNGTGAGMNLEEVTMEHLAELMEKYRAQDEADKAEYYQHNMDEMKNFRDIEDSVMRLLTDYQMPVTFYNMMAATQLSAGAKFFQNLQEQNDSKVNDAMSHMLERMEDEESMDQAYEELQNVVKQASEDAIEQTDAPTYLDMNQWKMIGKTVNLMGELGRRKQYFIPFETKDGVGSIRLKLVSDSDNAGRMEMSFETKTLGNVYALVQMDGNKASGYMVTDRTEAEDMLIANVDKLRESLEDLGITECDFKVGYSKDSVESGLHTSEQKVSSSMLYRMSKTILTNLIAIESNE